MKIKSHHFGNDDVSFRVTDTITGEVKTLETVEYAAVPDDDKTALTLIDRADTAARKGHAGAMRFILSALKSINPVYAGMGLVTDDKGKVYRAKQSTEESRKAFNGYKEAFRDVCKAVMMPALVEFHKGNAIKAEEDLTEKRSKGTFAVSASAARKFFYFTGTLPCAYLPDGTPDTSRALSVSAMQKIISEIPEEETDSHTFAAKVRALTKQWEENGGRTEDPADMSALLGYLDAWREMVRDAEVASLMATTGAMMPAARAYEGSDVKTEAREVGEALM